MRNPVFAENQFVDASGVGGLNQAFNSAGANVNNMASVLAPVPGIFSPESMSVVFTGLSATVNLPLPWALISSGGIRIAAHGTVAGLDTQSYTVNLSGLVPSGGAGPVTAWLAASGIIIQQDVFQLPGPPPGHPSYNPNFVPGIGYATNQDSVALFATTGVPDNITTFGLLNTVLTSATTGVTSWSLAGQTRVGGLRNLPYNLITAGAMTLAQAQLLLSAFAAGQTNTLPLSSGSAGLAFQLLNATSGFWTIAASGSDVIGGLTLQSTASALQIPPSGACEIWTSGGGIWALLSANPTMLGVAETRTFSVTGAVDGQAIAFSTPFRSGIPLVQITDAGGFGPATVTVYSTCGVTASGFILRAQYFNPSTSGFQGSAGAAFTYFAQVA